MTDNEETIELSLTVREAAILWKAFYAFDCGERDSMWRRPPEFVNALRSLKAKTKKMYDFITAHDNAGDVK